METLKINTGVKEYNINDVFVLRLNPTDLGFTERMFNVFNDLDARQEAYKRKWETTGDKAELFDLANEMNDEMCTLIDNLIGAGACAAIFGDMNVYAVADGLPVWANLLLAIIDEMDTSFAREQKLTNVKIKKYTEKYHK